MMKTVLYINVQAWSKDYGSQRTIFDTFQLVEIAWYSLLAAIYWIE